MIQEEETIEGTTVEEIQEEGDVDLEADPAQAEGPEGTRETETGEEETPDRDRARLAERE